MRPVSEFSGTSLAKGPHLQSNPGAHQGGRKSPGGGVFASSTDSNKKVS